MKIFVTGATGFVGRALVKHLQSQHQVYCLVRNVCRAKEMLGDAPVLIEADLLDIARYEKQMGEAEVVCHLAASITDAWISNLYRVNCLGTQKLVEAIKRSRVVKKFVYLSSIAVIGRSYVGKITEDTACHPFTPYGKSKLQAEKIISYFADHSEVKVAIVRAPIVYGRGQPQIVTQFFEKVRSGKILLPGDGHNKRSMCYIENLTSLLCWLIEGHSPSQSCEIFNIADKETYSLNEVVRIMGAAFGGNEKVKNLPDGFSKLCAFLYQCLTTFGYSSPQLFSIAAATANIECDVSKIEKTTSFKIPVSFTKGIAETVEWLKSKQ